MASDNLADFLTFISPICILVLFFMCFFRFLFRSCECGTRDSDDIESCQSSRPTSSTTARIHPSCQMHPDMNPFGEFIIHCPAHCEELFPPKYEDALKLPVASARSESDRRLSLTSQIAAATRPSVSSPPPIYSDCEIPQGTSSSPAALTTTSSNELPPAYTMASQTLPSLYQPILRVPTASRRDSLTLPTSLLTRSPINSNETSPSSDSAPSTNPTVVVQQGPRLSRASLDEICAQFPITGPIQLRATSLSAINRTTARGVSRPPRVHLPGAVIENEEDEYYDDEPQQPQPRHTTSSSHHHHLALDSPLRQSASF